MIYFLFAGLFNSATLKWAFGGALSPRMGLSQHVNSSTVAATILAWSNPAVLSRAKEAGGYFL